MENRRKLVAKVHRRKRAQCPLRNWNKETWKDLVFIFETLNITFYFFFVSFKPPSPLSWNPPMLLPGCIQRQMQSHKLSRFLSNKSCWRFFKINFSWFLVAFAGHLQCENQTDCLLKLFLREQKTPMDKYQIVTFLASETPSALVNKMWSHKNIQSSHIGLKPGPLWIWLD